MHFCLLVSDAVGRQASPQLLNQDLIKRRILDDALSTRCIRCDRLLFISEFGAPADLIQCKAKECFLIGNKIF